MSWGWGLPVYEIGGETRKYPAYFTRAEINAACVELYGHGDFIDYLSDKELLERIAKTKIGDTLLRMKRFRKPPTFPRYWYNDNPWYKRIKC